MAVKKTAKKQVPDPVIKTPNIVAKPGKDPKNLLIVEPPPTKFISEPLAATTTAQEDLTKAGQRRINMVWELTQAYIAVIVVTCNMAAGMIFSLQKKDFSEYPFILSSSLFLVIGFYFSRTNHTATGGVGKQPPIPEYKGR